MKAGAWYLAASMALVGSYVGLSKGLVEVFPVFLLAGLRFGIAALAMLGWLRRPPEEAAWDGRDHWALFLGSFFGNFLFSVCMLYGVKASSAVAAGVVMASLPAAVALLGVWLLKERLARRTLWAVGLSVLGIGLLALARPPQAAAGLAVPSTPVGGYGGYALLLAAVFCEAAYVVSGKRLSRKLSPKRTSALINLWGLALVAPWAWQEARHFAFAGVAPADWLGLVFYALAASMGAVWLWMRGLRDIPATEAGVFTVMLPLASAAVGVFGLGESAGWLHLLALGLALAGVWVATRGGSQAAGATSSSLGQSRM